MSARLVERDDSDVEYNSDFESVHSNDELTFADNDDDDVDEHKSGRVKGEEEESNQNQPIRSCDLGAPISISIRAPDGSRFTIEQLRENSDASELMRRLEDKGYSCVQYELIRAYPRQKLDLSAGNALSDLSIKNQDAFHVQLKMWLICKFSHFHCQNTVRVIMFKLRMSRYDDFDNDDTGIDTNLEDDEDFNRALATSHGRSTFGGSAVGLDKKPPSTAYRPQTSTRPQTSNQSANYKKSKTSLIAKKDPIDELPEEAREEEKIKEMEKKVLSLVDESIITLAKGEHTAALDKAKAAGRLERQLSKVKIV